MAIINKQDIITDDAVKALDPLIAQYEKLNEQQKKLIAESKAYQQILTQIKKTNDGQEAQKLVQINNQLVKSNVKLKEVKTASVRVNEKILKANIKLAESRTKEAQQLELVKQKILQQNKALRDNAKATLGMQKRLGTFTKQILGAAGILGGMSAVVNIFRSAANTFKEFDKSSSRLAAILGKTKKEITTLTQQAKNLGAVTAFTASEVISLQTELAKLGFTSKQIESSTRGILDLAAATGQDLAQSAELAGATLRIFNLDASEMGRVTDVLAKSTTISSLSMEKLATIMPTVGKTAQLAGVSLERTAALAGTLTDRGLDASTAATSLRNIFLELSKKGLTWEQAMQKINSSTDKNKTAMDLFGKRAAAAGAILAETASDTDVLTNSLETAQGAAQEMADTMLDNLSGDITKAQSSWEGFILSLEDGEGAISRIARNMTQFFTGLLQALKNFNDETAKLDDFSKKKLGLTQRENQLLKAQKDELTAITDKEQQRIRATQIFARLQKEKNALEKIALQASEEGDKKKVIAAQAELDIRLKLIENVKQYIPELRKENVQIDENNIKTNASNTKRDTNSKKIDKQAESLKKLNDQLQREAEFRRQDERSAIGLPGVDQEALDIAGMEALDAQLDEMLRAEEQYEDDRVQARIDANNKILEDDIETQKFIKDLKKTFEDEATQYALNVASQLAEDKKNKELNRIEAEKDALKDQLDKGLINEIQYQTKLAELNKQARAEEAKAAKRQALYEIAIATAIAVAKAIPNLLRMARAAALGAVQAAFVAARPLPKFEKGGEIGGKRHSEGGTVIEAEKGEFVLNRQAYSNAPMLAEAINSGMIRDRDLGLKKGQKDNLVLGMMIQGLRKDNKQVIELLSNMGYAIPKKDYIEERRSNGEIFKHIIK